MEIKRKVVFSEKGTPMKEEKSTNPEIIRKSRTEILDQFTNHPVRSVLIVFIIFVIIVLMLIPAVFVYSTMFWYNNSTEANMHVTASSNLIIAFITLLYVVLTWYLVSENRKIRKIQTEPNVYLFIEPKNVYNKFTDFFIQNIGMGAAFNIEFNVLSDFIYSESNYIDNDKPVLKKFMASDAPMIKYGIKYLAPAQKKRLFSTIFGEVEEENQYNNNQLKVHIRYKDNTGTEKKGDFTLSLYEVPANGMGELTTFENSLIANLNGIKDEVHEISQKVKYPDYKKAS